MLDKLDWEADIVCLLEGLTTLRQFPVKNSLDLEDLFEEEFRLPLKWIFEGGECLPSFKGYQSLPWYQDLYIEVLVAVWLSGSASWEAEGIVEISSHDLRNPLQEAFIECLLYWGGLFDQWDDEEHPLPLVEVEGEAHLYRSFN
jgi:hypothetical protein